jgi:hypothetical protein
VVLLRKSIPQNHNLKTAAELGVSLEPRGKRMDYFIEIVKALAWPLTVVWLSLQFRGEIRLLLGRMSKFKFKDLEASFEMELAKAEAAAEKADIHKISNGADFITRTDQLLRIASISPKAAIVEAWSLIEHAAGKTGFTSGASIQRANPRAAIEYLKNSGKLTEENLKLVNDLHRLRNQASHLPDFIISYNEAERYLMLASQCASLIEQKES